MSAEFIRRRLVTRIGGNNKNTVIDTLASFFAEIEEKVGTIEEIEAPNGDYLPFRLEDGTRYEVYNWAPYVDIADSKKKGIELQPLAYQPVSESESGGGGGNLFGSLFSVDISIVWFCVFAVWLGLVVGGFVIAKAVFFK